MSQKDKNDLINQANLYFRKVKTKSQCLQIASKTFNGIKPLEDQELNSYTPQNWFWFFETILKEEVHPKKTQIWEQAMYPWKKF